MVPLWAVEPPNPESLTDVAWDFLFFFFFPLNALLKGRNNRRSIFFSYFFTIPYILPFVCIFPDPQNPSPNGSVNNRTPRGSACAYLVSVYLTGGISSYLSHFGTDISQGLPEIIQALGMGNNIPWQSLGNNDTR